MSRLNKMTNRFAIFSIVLVLQACDSTPVTSVSYLEIKVRALEILKQSIAINTLCKPSDFDLSEDTLARYQQWQNENWELVQGADSFFWSTQRKSTLHFNGITFSHEATDLFQEQRSHAIRAAKQKFGRLSSEACNYALDLFLPSTAMDPNLKGEIYSYAEQHPQPPIPGALIPSLAVNFTRPSSPGRSQFSVEKIAHQLKCSQPRIYTLKNQWPEEVYALFCQEKQIIILCEWGNCKLVD